MLSKYLTLIRLHKPIGIFLLLWPTLWALWLAGAGHPELTTLGIFIVGVFLMRSAGCVVNDVADRHIDGHVARTRDRPIASGRIAPHHAIIFAMLLLSVAFVLVLFCNLLTIKLAFVGAALAVIYPFLKRITHLPQLGLGAAFGWAVPMAFAAENNTLNPALWWVFAAAVIWPIIYDTMYAMADREDDIKIGVKSTAILFGDRDVSILVQLQALFILLLIKIGYIFHLNGFYFISLFVVALSFLYQYLLIKDRKPANCFAAFTNNNWVGFIIFIGIVMSYQI